MRRQAVLASLAFVFLVIQSAVAKKRNLALKSLVDESDVHSDVVRRVRENDPFGKRPADSQGFSDRGARRLIPSPGPPR